MILGVEDAILEEPIVVGELTSTSDEVCGIDNEQIACFGVSGELQGDFIVEFVVTDPIIVEEEENASLGVKGIGVDSDELVCEFFLDNNVGEAKNFPFLA